jgi:hypothetical protein
MCVCVCGVFVMCECVFVCSSLRFRVVKTFCVWLGVCVVCVVCFCVCCDILGVCFWVVCVCVCVCGVRMSVCFLCVSNVCECVSVEWFFECLCVRLCVWCACIRLRALLALCSIIEHKMSNGCVLYWGRTAQFFPHICLHQNYETKHKHNNQHDTACNTSASSCTTLLTWQQLTVWHLNTCVNLGIVVKNFYCATAWDLEDTCRGARLQVRLHVEIRHLETSKLSATNLGWRPPIGRRERVKGLGAFPPSFLWGLL